MRFKGANEIYCKSCQHFEALPRAPRSDDVCPACGAGVYRREGPAPDPISHLGELVRAMGSLSGVLFIVGVALIASVPHVTLRALAAVMITLASLKLAVRAMNVSRKDGIGFPEVSPEELFDRSALLPATVFAVVFALLPRLMITIAIGAPDDSDVHAEDPAVHAFLEDDGTDVEAPIGEDATWHDDDDEEQVDAALAEAIAAAQRERAREAGVASATLEPQRPPASTTTARATSVDDGAGSPSMRVAFMLLALALFFYAPMALVSFLRSGSTWAILSVPRGISDIAQDPRGYARLCAVAVTALVVGLAVDVLTIDWPFYAAPLVHIPRNAVQLFAWGVCGLYVRSRARQLSMPIDGDDWVLLTRHQAPPAPAEPARVRPTSISLDDEDDIPIVTGAALPEHDPHR